MRKAITILLIVVLIAAIILPLLPVLAAEQATSSATEEVIVSMKTAEALASASSTIQILADDPAVAITEILPDANSIVLSVPSGSSNTIIQALEASQAIAYAEPNYARPLLAIDTNDTFRASLWALDNTGQVVSTASGTPNADIDGKEAWTISTGTSTIVAVIDTGVLYTHPDLAANMWQGTSCVSDAGTPLGTCIHGYDFADNDPDPLPLATTSNETGHGTHVAGTIAAVRNNSIGTIGVAPNATIMAIRFGLDVASEVRAIDFARLNGAKIINASYGGTQFSQAEFDAIKRFTDAGGVFVAAAGNQAQNLTQQPLYPAAYDNPNILRVAASTQNDTLASFSNFGSTTSLAAPGANILSTFTSNGSSTEYAFSGGTSMATPHVSATVALIWSRYPLLTQTEVLRAIDDGAIRISALRASGIPEGKRLNTYRALLAAGGADVLPPIITRTGATTIPLTLGDTYTELGATALDNRDATTTVRIGGDVVATTTAGTYQVTYDATDTAGNNAEQVVRTVIVTAPAPQSSGGGGGGGSGGGSSSGGSSRSGGGGGSSSKARSTNPTNTSKKVPSKPVRNKKTNDNPARLPQAPPAAKPTINPILFTQQMGIGSTGEQVLALQQVLTEKGLFVGPVTGYFGPRTAASVRAFQQSKSIPALGSVGPKTRAALNEVLR